MQPLRIPSTLQITPRRTSRSQSQALQEIGRSGSPSVAEGENHSPCVNRLMRFVFPASTYSRGDFMPDPDDPLQNELREHVFGLGLISLHYNLFESALRFILSTYTDRISANLLFEKSSNEQRCGAIRALATAKESDPIALEHLDHLLTFYSRCAENRNILMHSRPSLTEDPTEADGLLRLEKRLKAGGHNIYRLDLRSIKQVANDMIAGITYLLAVDKLIGEPRGLLSLGAPRTWPERPPLPRMLNPHQPVVSLEGDQPQFGLSPG